MKDVRKILGYQPTFYYDAGHYYSRTNPSLTTPGKRINNVPGVGTIYEHQFNRPVADLTAELLKLVGFRVFDAAPERGKEISLPQRSNAINQDYVKQCKLNPGTPGQHVAVGISFHFNAIDGVLNEKAGGMEVHYYKPSATAKRFAQILLNHMSQGTEQKNRGLKTYDLHMTRETYPIYVLGEFGFMDNVDDVGLMLNSSYHMECARECAAAVCEYFGLDYRELVEQDDKGLTPILSEATATVNQAQAWARAKGATEEFIGLAPLFWKHGDRSGVNPVGAYAQAAKETGYGKFGGVIDASYHNTCGLKISAGGGNYDPHAHKRFKDWDQGVEAHIDHDAIYAGAPGYPRKGTPDPRHFAWILGKAPNWEDLGGKWAPSLDYGKRIVAMMEQIEATVVETGPDVEALKDLLEKQRLQLEELNAKNSEYKKVIVEVQDTVGGIKL